MAVDLTFRATVEKIENSPLGIRAAFLDWIVHTRVIEVMSGDFTGDQFAFRVHSPSRAGLAVGITCTITATWTGDGYRVDEDGISLSQRSEERDEVGVLLRR